MPNWSKVSIEFISEDKKLINELFHKLKSNGYGINEELTLPKDLKKDNSSLTENEKKVLVEKYGCSDWYKWSIQNWGTKWDMLDSEDIEDKFIYKLEKSGQVISIVFNSPWRGPFIWFEKVCQKYNLTGSYIDVESGNDFCLKIEYCEGCLTEYKLEDFLCSTNIETFGYRDLLWCYESFDSLKREYEFDYQIFIDCGITKEEIKSFFDDEKF